MNRFLRTGFIAALFICLVLGFGAGCASHSAEEAEAAPPSFPAKSVATNTFCFTALEKKQAIKYYHRLRANILFELIIDRSGNVVRLKVVRTNLDSFMTSAYKTHVMQGMKFTPAAEDDPYPYRAMYYPVSNRTEIIER